MSGHVSVSGMFFNKNATFAEMGLDHRLLKAVAQMGFVHPTLVQDRCILLAMEGRDLLARANTGSGKTLAYCVPVIQNILTHKQSSPATDHAQEVSAVILVPTRELVHQVRATFEKLLRYCSDVVRVVALEADAAFALQAVHLKDMPDILLSTPARLVEHCAKGSVVLKDTVRMLVIDEADLALSFGYEDDVKALVSYLPQVHQSILMSATLSPEIEALKSLVLHKPAIVKVEEEKTEAEGLSQFWLECPSKDKHLLVFALLKLQIIGGKTLFFVNSVDSCFRLKLFLEQFSIGSAVLNAELPVNSRLSIIDQFNRGMFDILICTDESIEYDESQAMPTGSSHASKVSVEFEQESEEDEGDEGDEGDVEESKGQKKKKQSKSSKQEEKEEKADAKKAKRRRGRKKQQSFGVARGLDFHNVQTVVNVDFPLSVKNYVHRIGRTARAGKSGEALSLVSPGETDMLDQVLDYQKVAGAGEDEIEVDPALQLLQFNMRNVESFRYRVEDVSRSVTRVAVREARLKELKNEMMNSDKLKAHFEDNPRELELLKHDKVLRPKQVRKHLASVPDYLQPQSGPKIENAKVTKRKRSRGKKGFLARKRKAAEESDPLKTFSFNSQMSKQPKLVLPKTGAAGAFSEHSVGFDQSTAGRRKWKNKHRTGQKGQDKKRKKWGNAQGKALYQI